MLIIHNVNIHNEIHIAVHVAIIVNKIPDDGVVWSFDYLCSLTNN
jgi:hypothetical protein